MIPAIFFLRWLLLPLLIYLVGQYLEGPAYRVLVRGLPFVVAAFALSVLAAQFLRRAKHLPWLLMVAQALVVPAGFVYSLQQYYDGGGNGSNVPAALFFSGLMALNAVIYLNSLFSLRVGVRPERKMPENSTIHSYGISLHTLGDDGRAGMLVFEQHGDGAPPEVMTIDGYSHSIAIPLDAYWEDIQQQRLEHFRTQLTIRETIVKFGETRQLVDDCLLAIDVVYKS